VLGGTSRGQSHTGTEVEKNKDKKIEATVLSGTSRGQSHTGTEVEKEKRKI
jgi:hypothetical protein